MSEMSEHSPEIHQDRRIRRTRGLLQNALATLLEQASFSDISITDICKQADIARVTFYQHYESKEALLLANVISFFSSMHQTVDLDAVDRYLETGDMTELSSVNQMDSAGPVQPHLISTALEYIGADVRRLTLASFLETYSQRETKLNERQMQVLATFYVGGMLTLMEQSLSGQLAISPAEFQTATLTFLRAARQAVLHSNLLTAKQSALTI